MPIKSESMLNQSHQFIYNDCWHRRGSTRFIQVCLLGTGFRSTVYSLGETHNEGHAEWQSNEWWLVGDMTQLMCVDETSG